MTESRSSGRGPENRRIVWRVALLGGALIVAWFASTALAQSLWTPTQDPIAGSRVFGSKGCSKCHAVRGLGGKIGPDLALSERPRSFYDLASELWNHAPRMAQRMSQLGIARPQLDARETGDLIAFLYTIDYFDPPGDRERGRKLFTAKRCVMCHQVGGTGGVIGPNFDAVMQFDSPIGLAAAMWNHGPRMVEAMRAKKIARPTFKDRELIDLIAFINATSRGPRASAPLLVLPGRADEGRQLFAEKRCVTCHAVAGQGADVGPDLARRAVPESLTQFAAAMWNKAPAMMAAMKKQNVPVPQISPEEMADIVGYLYSVRYFAASGDPRSGERVARAKGCFGCHASPGEQGKPAVDLTRVESSTASAVLASLWNHSFIAQAKPGAAWPELKSSEMSDLIAYLLSQRSGR
jgi:mono/diheme cytochrome c family protein